MIKIGVFSKFPPEKTGTAVYAQKLVDALNKKCRVVKIGFGNSNCDYNINLEKNFIDDVKSIVEKEHLDIFHLQHAASIRTFDLHNKSALISHAKTWAISMKLIKMMSVLGVPTICTIHDMVIDPENIKDFLIRWLEKKMITNSSYVIVHSVGQKHAVENYTKNVACIHHGIKIINTTPVAGKNILCLGRISQNKGLEYLLNAMKHLPDFNLKIAGEIVDRNYATKLREIVSSNKLKNVEIKFGWVSGVDQDKMYRHANLVVLPYKKTSRYSMSGNFHDALSYRVPIVVSNTGGMQEIVEQFKCGVVIDSFDSESLVAAIKKVSQNYKKYIFGIDAYRKEANWDKVAEKHVKLYKRLIRPTNI